MSDILPDINHPNMINAMDENMFTIFDSFDALPNVKWYNSSELKECVSDVAHPLFNIVMRARLSDDNVETEVKRIARRAKETGYGTLWRVDNASTPDSLEDYLLKNGFEDAGDEPGMAANLSDQRDKIKLSEGVELRELSEDADIAEFVTTLIDGFGMPEFLKEHMTKFCRLLEWERVLILSITTPR